MEEAAAAARAAGERLGDGELPAGTAGGWELAQRRVGAVRAGGRRCSPGPAEEGSRLAGEVQLASGVQQQNQATDGQCDRSVGEDWASL